MVTYCLDKNVGDSLGEANAVREEVRSKMGTKRRNNFFFINLTSCLIGALYYMIARV